MKRVTKLAILTNAALAVLLLVVGVVCFLPVGVSTAGKLSDRVYYSGNTDSKYVSVMINVYWGTEYIPAMLDVLDEYNAKATFLSAGAGRTTIPKHCAKSCAAGMSSATTAISIKIRTN